MSERNGDVQQKRDISIRFVGLSPGHRQVLGWYFQEQRRRSMEDVPEEERKFTRPLIAEGKNILRHIYEGDRLRQVSPETARLAGYLKNLDHTDGD